MQASNESSGKWRAPALYTKASLWLQSYFVTKPDLNFCNGNVFYVHSLRGRYVYTVAVVVAEKLDKISMFKAANAVS